MLEKLKQIFLKLKIKILNYLYGLNYQNNQWGYSATQKEKKSKFE